MKPLLTIIPILLSLNLLHAETYTVTSPLGDNSMGTLRWCAEGAYDGDIVVFADDVHYIDLGSLPVFITNAITIDGPGRDNLTVTGASSSGNGLFIVNEDTSAMVTMKDFSINEYGDTNTSNAIKATTPLTIENLIITNSNGSPGRAIRTSSDLVIANSTLSYGLIDSEGGGAVYMHNSSTPFSLQISNSEIAHNQVVDYTGSAHHGAGIYVNGEADINITGSFIHHNSTLSPGAGAGYGGAMYISASMTSLDITDTNITFNSAQNGGGVYLFGCEGQAVMSNCIIEGNEASGEGGGIYSTYATKLTLSDSNVSGNSAGNDGGGIYATGDELDQLFIKLSRIEENNASGGGGVYAKNGMQVKLEESVLSHNMVTGAGGGASFSNNSLYINQSLFHDNSALYAGGMVLGGSTQGATIINTTVSNNDATAYGGGILANYATTSTSWVDIKFCTVTANVADADNGGFTGLGGGIAVGDGSQSADFVYLSQSIVAGNMLGDGSDNDLYGVAISNKGYNLIGVDNGNGFADGINNDIVGTTSQPIDARLTPLVNNGGPTFTHALLQDSPANNAAGSQGLGYPSVDQRGEPRPCPVGNHYDIGAYEACYANTNVSPALIMYLLN